ncbi:hypothetical protein BP6252_06814 [Coleophoma cylindrospora]|uniref:WW domain-containing protein n=1 Tax=Coleophoma cylindrospora TaxID=1849047 RepID=A0A3D8RFU0_9HELO|nr:hypothetical protein BP6252_06814 [Coleophoma cylindrospora]
MTKYEYQALADSNDIRVVQIFPGEFDDDIHLRITHTSLAHLEPEIRQPVDIMTLYESMPLEWRVFALTNDYNQRVAFIKPTGPIDTEIANTIETDTETVEAGTKKRRMSLNQSHEIHMHPQEIEQSHNDEYNNSTNIAYAKATNFGGESSAQMDIERVETNELDSYNTFWDHPDLEYDRDLYRPLEGWSEAPTNQGFEALSYVWGPQGNFVTAIVENENKPSSTLQLGQNLASALRHLRLPDRSRMMWIDAICINQENRGEREVQVQRMADIYSLASRVVVWLGPESDDSAAAIEFMKDVGKFFVEESSGYWLAFPGYQNADFDLSIKDMFQAVRHLIHRPWFSRLWVVQEVSLGNRHSIFQCGKSTIYRRELRGALWALANKLQEIDNTTGFDSVVNLVRQASGKSNFGNLINQHYMRACSDPRDKVYGLLGIAAPEFRSRIAPNYSIPVADIYKQVMKMEIEVSQRLDILQGCYIAAREATSPTWIPDWSVCFSPAQRQHLQIFSSGNSVAQVVFHQDDVLECSGLLTDRVRYVGREMPWLDVNPYDRSRDWVEVVKGWMADKMEDYVYPTGGNYLEAFVSVLLQGQIQERSCTANFPPLASAIDQILALTDGGWFCSHHGTLRISEMIYQLAGRPFFMTEKGYYGIGPPGTQEGDCVSVLLGCDFPLLLRPTSKAMFHVVGSAYVHGLHDAISLLGVLPPGWRVHVCSDGSPLFVNDETDVTTREDPRLEPLVEWEGIADSSEHSHSVHSKKYDQQKQTGDKVNADPRMLPEALKARGVNIQTIFLV